jgi:hypothetical protein
MSELEKKFSDFQKTECKDFEVSTEEQTEKYCPTCIPNPSFTLESPWWEIQESYLNEAECEYHIRISKYESLSKSQKYEIMHAPDSSVAMLYVSYNIDMQDLVNLGVEEILKDQKKPYNDEIITNLIEVAYVKDGPYDNNNTLRFGSNYLIAIPAFNFDQINPEEVEKQSNTSIDASLEVIVDATTLSRNIRQLRISLELYNKYYSLAQHQSNDSFVIRQEKSKAFRLSYMAAVNKLRDFKEELNDLLHEKNYARLDSIVGGSFAKKVPSKIKFVFNDNEDNYDLKGAYVRSYDGCNFYEPLKVKNSSLLKNKSMKIIFHFMSRIEEMISEITAKDPKPWAEWTVDHWYPQMVLDNEIGLDTEDMESGLNCLIEGELGLGPKLTDFLAKEIMSAFKSIEQEAQKEACREITRLAEGSATAIADGKGGQNPSAEEQRAALTKKKYSENYKNQFYDEFIKELTTLDPSANKNNIFEILKKHNLTLNFIPKPMRVRGQPEPYSEKGILTLKDLNDESTRYADVFFNAREDSKGLLGYGNQIQNSPHWQDAIEAQREFTIFPENSVLSLFKKEGRRDAMRAMSLCNVGELGKKAAKCLLAGVSMDDFLDAIIDKSFQFMKINTLELFLNGLPNSFRTELDAAIAREFGGSVNIATLISLKKVNESETKLSDITKTKQVAKELLKISQKVVNNKSLTVLENDFVEKNILDFSHGQISDTFTKDEYEQFETYAFAKPGSPAYSKELEKDAKKKSLKILKKKIRDKKEPLMQRAMQRIGNSTIAYTTPDDIDDPDRLPSTFETAVQSFEETALGTKVAVVFDVIFDFAIDYILESFSVDELIEDLRKYPVMDFIGDLVVTAYTCPNAPVIYPPISDFAKTLSIDVCDPTFDIMMPQVVWPNINPLTKAKALGVEIIREKMIDLCTDLYIRMVTKLLNSIESGLCSALGVGANAAAGIVKDPSKLKDFTSAKNTFIDALNESFCNDSSDPKTGKKKAEELAAALFSPLLLGTDLDYNGSSERVTNVLSSVAGTNDFLSAMVARSGEGDPQFGRVVSNAINILTPEMSELLGTPNQVAYFFSSIGSFLSPDDRGRIRNLLDAGIPNLPLSKAICMNNESLEDWNNLRKNLLSNFPNPAEIVNDWNNRTMTEADEALDFVGNGDDMFTDAIRDELSKDVCNPNNVFNDVYQTDLEKEVESALIDGEYENLTRVMSYSFFRNNGIIGRALSDTEGNSEFFRMFLKFLFPGYTNSPVEWQGKYDSKLRFGQWFMNNYNDGEPKGNYPQTVGLKLRDDLLDGMIDYDFEKVKNDKKSARNVVFKYKDEDGSFVYRLQIAASNLRQPKKVFGYNLQVLEKTESDTKFEAELNYNTPVVISEAENDFMESYGFSYKSNEQQDIRKAAFNEFMRSKIPINRNYDELYERTYEMCTQNLVEALYTDTNNDDEIPNGFKFGYVSDNITKDSFEYYNPDTKTSYNLDEEEKVLGEYASNRIIALDPEKYGGRYSNPHFYIEPRQHFGWSELAVKSFKSKDGCTPKTQPILDMSDIRSREKDLANTLSNDPRLSRDPECINDIPFKVLANGKMKAKMDGAVRTTIRTYLAEYFMKGYGLFSNLQVRFDNFDQSLPLYIANKMKNEMMQLGSFTSNRNVRIVRERYWYTFLEQSVEAYQRMIEIDGVEPPSSVQDALDEIQLGIDLYRNITRDLKKSMRLNLPDSGVNKPSANFDPLTEVKKGMMNMGYMAIAFRISSEEDRKTFFNGQKFTDITAFDIRMSSIKKLRFFQKIYFIRLYEKSATLIMSELIRKELNRLNQAVVDGISDKPNYFDLYRSFLGMNSFFPNSNSKVGTNDFYSNLGNAGEVPDVMNNNVLPPETESDEPQFIVERYVRFVDRVNSNSPPQIKNRGLLYQGVVSLPNASDFIDQNINLIEENYLSDFFGDLRFMYTSSFKSLLDNGFANSSSINILVDYNPKLRDQINSSHFSYVSNDVFEDFDVTHDASFLLDGDTSQPTGTTGSTGVKYGLRISLVLPNSQNGGLSDEQKNKMIENIQTFNYGKREKTLLFEDGTVVIPMVTSEIDVLDSTFNEFDPLDGKEPYDLECLINDIVEKPEFQLIFDKLFNFKQTSSMLAIYTMETLMPSIGRGAEERIEGAEEDPDSEQWDGTTNKFLKNMLRKKFKSIYLSGTVDGLSPDNDDDSERSFLRLGNPLSALTLSLGFKLPWWKIRLREYDVYDKDGEECADPKKDLR